MTKPPRLSDDARDVLAAYRQAAPGGERRRANLDAVLRRVEADAPPRAAAAAGLLWPIGWGLASAAAAAGLIWGVITVRAPEPAPPPPPIEDAPAVIETPAPKRSAPRPVLEQPDDAVVVPPPVQTPRARAVEPKPAAPETTDAPRSSDLREETRLLREVRASIAEGAYEDAASQLQAYTLAFPDGALREDAQAYRVVVACKQGRPASALRSAFARRYPDSPHTARIAAACEGEKE